MGVLLPADLIEVARVPLQGVERVDDTGIAHGGATPHQEAGISTGHSAR